MIRIEGGPYHGSRLPSPPEAEIGDTVTLKRTSTPNTYRIEERPGYETQLQARYLGDSA